jgi:predicted transcriptional regulator
MKKDKLSLHYEEKLQDQYDCIDRIVVNGYITKLQIPGGFRNWYRDLNGDDKDLTQSRLIKFAGRFSRRIYAFAQKKNIPIIECKAEQRKHEIANEHLPKDKNSNGLFLILKSRASAFIWEIETSKSGSINIKKKQSFVNHYFFHIMDKQWGHITIRMCSHPPFNCMIILNGHEFTERRLVKKNILFEKTDNCFTAYDDGVTLTQVADTCSIGQLEGVCNRWISSCLWFGVDYDDQQRTDLRYQYSIYQVEYSRNLLFKRGSELDQTYQSIIDQTRRSLNVERIKTLFGKKNRPHYSKSGNSALRVQIEIPDYNLTVFKIHFGALTLKLYDKGERTLRAEVVVHNTKDLKCKRRLEHFDTICKKLKTIMQSFLDNLLYAHVATIATGELQQMVNCQKTGKQKISGINPFKKMDIWVMHAVMAVCFKPFGFSTGDVVQKIKKMYGLNLKTPQVAYVLRKLKAKKMILSQEGKRKYLASPDGLQKILSVIVITEQQLPKVLAQSSKNDVLKVPELKENYRDAYFQLKHSIKDFIKQSPIKIAA